MTTSNDPDSRTPFPSRREFLASSSAAVVAGAIAGAVTPRDLIAQGAHATGTDRLRVGLVGCGGRGTGAAAQALAADPNVALTAMADAFGDRLASSLATLRQNARIAPRIDVPDERRFVGFDGYRRLLASGVDVVLLASPPHFRPAHLQAAIDAGVHVFAEKPVAVDAPGVRAVLAACEAAKAKRLSVVSGLCLRYSFGFQAIVQRIHDRAIGDVHAIQANDYRGPIWLKPRQAGWTDMEWQMRNWYYFTWLSGDFNVEQHVHFLDVAAWIMQGRYPVSAVGTGGRQVRTEAEYGNIYDHHAVTYEYADGARLHSHCRRQPGCHNDMSVHVSGTRGAARLIERRGGMAITGEKAFVYEGEDNDIYQTEHDALFAGIRRGTPVNHGDYMARSTLLAIMGRMATYTGQRITWDQAMRSTEDLTPAQYAWGPIPTPAIAVPGVTPFA